MQRTPAKALALVRKLCLAKDDATERESHGSPWFFVGASPSFASFHDNHHGDGRLAVWCACDEIARGVLLEENPTRFFVPPYVGHKGWVGVILDGISEDELAAVIDAAYATAALKRKPRKAASTKEEKKEKKKKAHTVRAR